MDPVHLGIAIIAALVTAGGLAWRIGAWFLNRIEKSIAGVDEKISKLDDKVGNLSSAVYELRGEVKGRTYSEMEQLFKDLQKGDR